MLFLIPMVLLLMINTIIETSCSKKDSNTQNLPTVTTSEISNNSQSSATISGEVVSDGGATVTERGVCYSTSQNPTISGSHTSSGSGTGTFDCNLTGLSASTTYHVRAYATNNVGTGYGSDKTFTTTSPTYIDLFDGSSLNTAFWQILDKTITHESGLNLYVNNALYIVRGPNNDNNGWYGIESIQEYPTFKSAKIDFWLDPVHNWQDHKIGFATPYGMMGYYNVSSSFWYDYFKAKWGLCLNGYFWPHWV